jgi:hypothetical protein
MNRHPLDVFGLCAGVFFVALAVGFLLDGLDVWDVDAGWIPPTLLIVLGIAGVLSTIGRASRPERPDGSEPSA